MLPRRRRLLQRRGQLLSLKTLSKRRQALGWGAASLGVMALAVVVRWQHLPVAMALGDSMGPWWVAARGALFTTPHAPPYGRLLAAPYEVILLGASSLWSAVAALLVLHALVAPLGLALTRRLHPKALAAPAVVGVALALDPNLLDTAVSGCEAYLAPLWIGALGLATTTASRWGPWLATLSFVFAVHNHPLAACAAPLLTLVRWRASPWAAAAGILALAPHGFALLNQPTGLSSGGVWPVAAMSAWWDQGGVGAALVLFGLVAGLASPATRPLAGATMVSVGLVVLAGHQLGYLRDYHLRLFTIPALAGIAALPRHWAWIGLVALRLPQDPVERPSQARRPGTVGLVHLAGQTILHDVPRPLVIDGAWVSGAPAIEPGALLLDLHLRGVPASDLAPGGQVVVVTSAERPHLGLLPSGLHELAAWDTWSLRRGTAAEVRAWSAALCAEVTAAGRKPPRLGGAWDGLAILHPDMGAAETTTWWDCPETPAPEGTGEAPGAPER